MYDPKGNIYSTTLSPDLGMTVEEGVERLYMTETTRKHHLPDTAGQLHTRTHSSVTASHTQNQCKPERDQIPAGGKETAMVKRSAVISFRERER